MSEQKVILGGKEWVVPMLAVKYNKIIDPLILSLLPTFAMWQADKGAALSSLNEQKYNDLLTIAYTALKAGNPIKQEEFEEMPVTLPELVTAFSIIAQQTGVFAKSEGRDTLGEAK